MDRLNSVEEKAEFVMAVKDYECEERQRWGEGVDIAASDANSDDKVLLRVITDPKSRSGFVGINAVREMAEMMEHEDYNKGVLISKRFTEAAKEEMERKNIQMVSDRFMPPLEPEKLYLKIQKHIDRLCKSECGKTPQKESDCKGYSNANYSCKIRLISDNASFHFERGWTSRLQNDLMRLLKIHNSTNSKKDKSK